MTDINKQKFLAELGKLLTFMYEEDRQTALAMYGRIFDEATDEVALLQLLGSPTRQAVVVARAYDSKERKLQVYSQSRAAEGAADEGTEAAYTQAILQIRQAAVSQHIIAPEVTVGQFTLFEDDDQERTEAFTYEDILSTVRSETAPAFVAAPAPEAEPVPEAAPMEEPADSVGDDPGEELPAPEENPADGQENAPESGADWIPPELQEAFLPEAEPAEEDAALTEEVFPLLPTEDSEPFAFAEPGEPTRKPRIFLLLLYILVAAPLTLIGIALLLVPTVLALLLAVTAITAGVGIFAAAFSGFAVLADILVVLGIALMVLALGLLFLWLFVWLIGGAIAGLVRSVLELGGRWCFKEVPAV